MNISLTRQSLTLLAGCLALSLAASCGLDDSAPSGAASETPGSSMSSPDAGAAGGADATAANAGGTTGATTGSDQSGNSYGVDAGAAADFGYIAEDSGSAGPSWDASPSGGGAGGGTGGSPNVGENGQCLPACNGQQCGPDGCGGSCGWCSGSDSCQDGACVSVAGCSPDCAGAMVGEADGCGGVCSGSGFGIGLAPGGAQDAAYYTSQVKQGQIPSANLLPIEGWLTAHGTALPAPKDDRLVTLHGFVGLFYDPAEGEPTVALQLGMNSGLSPEAIEAGHFNLSVVVDRSGSMEAQGKLDFVKEGLLTMLASLDQDDYLSIVTYSTTAKVALPPTQVTDQNRPQIAAVIEDIHTGGMTNLWGGLKLGYEQVMQHVAEKSLTPRVILLSDGVTNQGITDQPAILAGSASYNQAGVGVTTIGVGNDLNFDLMHLLATQGNGNFYFLDSAEKLTQVFQEEIKYLLTPVADNLQVSFSLPNGFGVEEVYGFEYKQENGKTHLLGPSPQYTVSAGEVVTEPDPNSEAPDVTVSTVFASKKNGLLMVKLQSPSADLLKDYENAALSTVYYSYDLVETGVTEAFDVDIMLGSLAYDTDSGGFHYFSGAIMQRNFCVLRSGLAMKTASALFNADPENNLQASIQTLATAITFCTGINVQLNDAGLIEDIALMETLKDNICAVAGCLDPAAQ